MDEEARPTPRDYHPGIGRYTDYIVTEARDGPLLTPPKAGNVAGVSGQTIRNWAEAGLLPYARSGQPERRRWLIPEWAARGRAEYLRRGGTDLPGTEDPPDIDQTPHSPDVAPRSAPGQDVDLPIVPLVANTEAAAPSPSSTQVPSAAPHTDAVANTLRTQAFTDNLLDRILRTSAAHVAERDAATASAREQHATLELFVRQIRAIDNDREAALPASLAEAIERISAAADDPPPGALETSANEHEE